MAADRGRSRRRLDGQEQSVRLRLAFPSFRQLARGNPFKWEGTLKPTDACSTYRVRITYYRHLARPRVEVLDPPIVPREEGGSIPHTLGGQRICLHLTEEWNPSMYIHETIVPWASLWLYYYEVWHATGEWLGGGHEPADGDATDAVPCIRDVQDEVRR